MLIDPGPVVAQSRRSRTSSEHERSHSNVRSAFAESVKAAARATVRVIVDGEPAALGTVVDADGLIVTKASLLRGRKHCRVRAGRILDATVIGVDSSRDLALLHVHVGELPAVQWEEGRPLEVGSWVASVGDSDVPVGIGVISTPPQDVPGPARADDDRGFLGVSLSVAEPGPLVDEVTRRSAAERAGILAGDIILRLDDNPVRTVEEVIRIIGSRSPGTRLRIDIEREGDPLELDATLGRMPEELLRRLFTQDRWGGGPFSRRRTGFPRVLTHDTVLAPTQCGGPLVDLDGRLAGVNIARAARVTTYALPAGEVRTTVERLLRSRRGDHLARRIDPAGVPGAVLLFGGEVLPEMFASRFLDLAGGERARLVVIGPVERAPEHGEPSGGDKKEWRGQKPDSLVRLPAKDLEQKSSLEAISTATGVWLDAVPAGEEGPNGTSVVVDALRGVLLRGGVVGAGAGGAALVGEVCLASGAAEDIGRPGGALVRGLALQVGPVPEPGSEPLASLLERNPALVGIWVQSGAALLLQGRSLSHLNGGEAAVLLASGGRREASPRRLRAGQIMDWIALRRAARDRGSPAFPPQEPGAPEVKSGALVIVGGGTVPPEALRGFIALAGGEDAPLVVLPTAMPAPGNGSHRDAEMLERAGARDVRVLDARSLEDVSSAEFREALERARGVWFGGGRQWRFVDAYLDTPACDLFQDVLRRGGVIGGSSAGASIQAEYLARGNPLGNEDIMAEGYERGLGFLPGVAIDQHFSERNRFADLESLVERFPGLLGIGIDEGTALVVEGHVGRVLGEGRVYFYDRRSVDPDGSAGAPVRLGAGERYDLEARRALNRRYRSIRV